MTVSERLLRVAELAELLDVSTATVYDWFEQGTLPGFKLPSGAVRFRLSDVEQWLEECRRNRP